MVIIMVFFHIITWIGFLGATRQLNIWVKEAHLPPNHDEVLSEFVDNIGHEWNSMRELSPIKVNTVLAARRSLDHLNWTTCTIIYDHSTASSIHMLTTSGSVFRYHTMFNYTSMPLLDLTERMTSFYMAEARPHNYLLMCSQACTNAIIQAGNMVDVRSNRHTYMRHHSRWLVVTSEANMADFSHLSISLDNVAVLSPSSCPCVKKGCVRRENRNGSEPCFKLSTLLMGEQHPTWSRAPRFDMSRNIPLATEVFPNIKYRYNRRQFLVTTKTWLGFTFSRVENGTKIYDGFCMEVLKQLSNNLNFTLMEPFDNEWGSVVDGKWIGIVGQLQRREVDMAMASLSRNAGRDAVIAFISTPFFKDYKDIMYRTLEITKDWTLLLDTFTPTVLGCIFTAMVTYTFLYVLIQLSPGEGADSVTIGTVSDIGLYVFGALFSQGGHILPLSWSGRFLVSSWWLFSIILSATYSAKLISTLAVPRAEKPFTSLKELLDNTEYKWGVVGRGSTYSLLSASNDPGMKRLFQGMVLFNKTDPSVLSGNNAHHIEKVMSEKYAYVMGHDKLGEDMDCRVTYLREKLFEYSKGMALPQNSPLKEDFDREMLLLSETGILNQLAKKWLIADSQCKSERSTATTVTIEDLQSAFYLLLVGIGGSCLVLLVEHWFRLLRGRMRKIKKKHY